ncbi:MAG: DUF418 domain-containing protein [Bacteroidales bacterium]|nr:DUF418 domain-containing protein [Bacteroidales bacterium]
MTTTLPLSKSPRLEVVDALRGFAIMAIMLLHNLEHFDFYYSPEYLPGWMKVLDKGIWDTLFFLFSGKTYAIFALLFGLTFYIMFSNQAKKGKDFRGRFLWRSFLLLIFGVINSMFYQGDILLFYAVLGVSLVVVCKWSDKAVLITAIILLLQPLEWIKLVQIVNDPAFVATDPLSWTYFGKMEGYITGSSFLDLVKGNLINGKTAVILWTYENGRILQTPVIFMLGMLLGRSNLFAPSEAGKKFWKKVLGFAVSLFAVLFTVKMIIPTLIPREATAGELNIIITSLANFAFMFVWVATFVLVFQKKAIHRILTKLEVFGKMSLTNYVMQSIVGSFIYYGFGLGLYKYTGATMSLFIGILLFLLQITFCRWWMKSHTHGPLEGIWHKLTWI